VSANHKDNFLLDTSALVTLLEDEAGADRVEAILRHEEVAIVWTTLLEIFYIPILLTAGDLKANYRISLADAIIAAYALHHKAILVHKDPELSALAGQLRLEALPFKKG
jgi:predicted nucleic acid-binding protein